MYKISKLRNGISLITVPLSGTRATTVLVLVPIGSRYERRKISGASHFVEHMMFKGTLKRPTAMDISRELDAVGADFNAFTSKDYTGYYVKVESGKQELAFDMISDMLFNSTFDAKEIEKEKGVIVEELRMYEDNPIMAISLLFDKVMFGDCPLGWDEGGNIDSVKGMTREDLWHYYKSAYEPRNMVVVVSGDMKGKTVSKLVDKYFSKQKPQIKPGKMLKKENFEKFDFPKTTAGLAHRVEVKEKKVDQAHVILGFPGLDYNHPDRYTAGVLLTVLGGGMSSRLFVEVREKRGLAYMVQSGSAAFRDTGIATVRAGLDPARLAEAMKVIKFELNRISTEKITARELADAKDSICGRMILGMEDSNAQAEWYSKQFWFEKEMETPEEVLRKIRKVKTEDILRLAKKLFQPDEMRLAVIGPVKKEDVLEMLK